jgi:hypothetical protein
MSADEFTAFMKDVQHVGHDTIHCYHYYYYYYYLVMTPQLILIVPCVFSSFDSVRTVALHHPRHLRQVLG